MSVLYDLEAWGLWELRQEIARNVGDCRLGDLVIVSQSAHIYGHEWEKVGRLLKRPRLLRRSRWVQDPRAGFTSAWPMAVS